MKYLVFGATGNIGSRVDGIFLLTDGQTSRIRIERSLPLPARLAFGIVSPRSSTFCKQPHEVELLAHMEPPSVRVRVPSAPCGSTP